MVTGPDAASWPLTQFFGFKLSVLYILLVGGRAVLVDFFLWFFFHCSPTITECLVFGSIFKQLTWNDKRFDIGASGQTRRPTINQWCEEE